MRRPNPYLRKVLTWPLLLRFFIGLALVIGGILSFLPVLGIWMLPLGIVVMFSGSRQVRMTVMLWFRKLRTWVARVWSKLGRSGKRRAA